MSPTTTLRPADAVAPAVNMLALVQPPPWPVPGRIILPEPPSGPATTATAALMLLLFGLSLAKFIQPPPRPKRTRKEEDHEDNKHVVKVKDVHTAVDQAVTGFEIVKVIFRYIIEDATKGWSNMDELEEKIKREALQPLVDRIMIKVRDFELSQLAERHHTRADRAKRERIPQP
jgi:hypothetical protein